MPPAQSAGGIVGTTSCPYLKKLQILMQFFNNKKKSKPEGLDLMNE